MGAEFLLADSTYTTCQGVFLKRREWWFTDSLKWSTYYLPAKHSKSITRLSLAAAKGVGIIRGFSLEETSVLGFPPKLQGV